MPPRRVLGGRAWTEQAARKNASKRRRALGMRQQPPGARKGSTIVARRRERGNLVIFSFPPPQRLHLPCTCHWCRGLVVALPRFLTGSLVALPDQRETR